MHDVVHPIPCQRNISRILWVRLGWKSCDSLSIKLIPIAKKMLHSAPDTSTLITKITAALQVEYRSQRKPQGYGFHLLMRVLANHVKNFRDSCHFACAGLCFPVFAADSEEFVDSHDGIVLCDPYDDVPVHDIVKLRI